ncbi:nickel-binding protein [Confluentibacter citreus]|uniref:nickel-binding protein n=1 Tax=Confluentibacter citreus TaxID=2007307 RepID=UPI000C28BD11|nr:nickel-binding protein [Confluentibacter citreus]
MPVFMDLHSVPGITAKDAALAHYEDLKVQDQYGCKCMTYWVDEKRDSAFCLIEAPDKEAVIKMHGVAHGLIPHEIIQVDSNIVQAFLGRIHDPAFFSELTNPDVKIFNDPAFRIILICKTMDMQIVYSKIRNDKARQIVDEFKNIFKTEVESCNGTEVKFRNDINLASFVSVSQALNCAISLNRNIKQSKDLLDFKITLHAGTPVEESDSIFGSTIQFAEDLCFVASNSKVILSPLIKDLCIDTNNATYHKENELKCITNEEEQTLKSLMKVLRSSYLNPNFDGTFFSESIGMSKSNLYRKCVSLTGFSPNNLIRNYRLIQSIFLLNKGCSISQTAFDSGFSSPSYFSKCFQKRFGIQPYNFKNL